MENLALLDEYIAFCRHIGAWTDWIQGPGGNFSIKDGGKHILVKKSGALIGKTTREDGWVLCDWRNVVKAYSEGRENIEDTVVAGSGKPSIETFLHTLPWRMIMHAHPTFLMNDLTHEHLQTDEFMTVVPYTKPGIPLFKELIEVYKPNTSIYLMKNHGVLICGNTLEEILEKMAFLSDLYSSKEKTDVRLVSALQTCMHTKMIKPLLFHKSSGFNERLFFPYTPDIAVFLQSMPLVFESLAPGKVPDVKQKLEKYKEESGYSTPSVICTHNMIYVVGETLEQLNTIQEVFYAYLSINRDHAEHLSFSHVKEIVNWDKEIARKTGK